MVAIACAALSVASFADEESKKDHPMVPRYPGSYPLGNPGLYRAFDQYTLVLGKIKGDEQAEKTQLLEGRVYSVLYNNPQGRSLLEIFRNYEQGLTRAGFRVLYSCTDRECGGRGQFERNPLQFHGPDYLRRYLAAKLTRPQGDVYVSLLAQQQAIDMTGDTQLAVIELKPMDEGLVKVNAESMKTDLRTSGHVALYGIYFDSGKSEVKPESEPALTEIAKLLRADSKLKLHVVGHTDSVGEVVKNMELSRARARAVVQALTSKYAVATARLRPEGLGPLSPVASNKNDTGRAQNRRVELVEQ